MLSGKIRQLPYFSLLRSSVSSGRGWRWRISRDGLRGRVSMGRRQRCHRGFRIEQVIVTRSQTEFNQSA